MGIKKPNETLIKTYDAIKDGTESSENENSEQEEEYDDEEENSEEPEIDYKYTLERYDSWINESGEMVIIIPEEFEFFFNSQYCPNCHRFHEDASNDAEEITEATLDFEEELNRLDSKDELPYANNLDQFDEEDFEGLSIDMRRTKEYYTFTLGVFNQFIKIFKPTLHYNTSLSFIVNRKIMVRLCERYQGEGHLIIDNPLEFFYDMLDLKYDHPSFNYPEEELLDYAKRLYKNREKKILEKTHDRTNPEIKTEEEEIQNIYNDLIYMKSRDPFILKIKEDFFDRFEEFFILDDGKDVSQYKSDTFLTDIYNDKTKKDIGTINKGFTREQLYEKYLEYDKDSKDNAIYRSSFNNTFTEKLRKVKFLRANLGYSCVYLLKEIEQSDGHKMTTLSQGESN